MRRGRYPVFRGMRTLLLLSALGMGSRNVAERWFPFDSRGSGSAIEETLISDQRSAFILIVHLYVLSLISHLSSFDNSPVLLLLPVSRL